MYVINLDDKESKGTHWVSLFIERHVTVCFDSFDPQDLFTKIKHTTRFYYVWFSFYCLHRIYNSKKKFVRLHQFIFS